MEEEMIQETPEVEEIQAPEAEEPEGESYPQFEAHIQGLQQQAEELRQSFPDFDLRDALGDPVFLQLTAPGTGISVADAYYALHRQEIQAASTRAATEKVVSAIQAGARRPREAGVGGQSPGELQFRYENASKEQREAFKKELRKAWGRGETVYPR